MTWLLAGQIAIGAAAGAAAGAASLALLRRQVRALATGRGGVACALLGLAGRLAVIGGGLVLALLWSLWCGLAFVLGVVVTRQAVMWKARSGRDE